MFIAPASARLNTCREEHFQLGVRKDHGAHVAAVGDQAGQLAEVALQLGQRIAHGLVHGDGRGAVADGLGPDRQADFLAPQPDPVRAELHFEAGGDLCQGAYVGQVNPGAIAGQRHQPVQGAAVEQVEAHRIGDLVCDRTLARGGRPVNGDDVDDSHWL
ncbi:hypothetical protein D9M70_554050 [compost metagenome]